MDKLSEKLSSIEGLEHELQSVNDLMEWIITARDTLQRICQAADCSLRLSEELGKYGVAFRSPNWTEGDSGAGFHYLLIHQGGLIRDLANAARD